MEARGVLLKNLNGGVPTGSPNPNPVSDQKSNFPPPLSDLATKLQTRCQAWNYLGWKANKILYAYYSFFLIHLEWKRQIRSYTSVVPSKILPDSGPKWVKCIPVFRPKRPKNPTVWGGTYLCGLYKGVPTPPPHPPRWKILSTDRWNVFQIVRWLSNVVLNF